MPRLPVIVERRAVEPFMKNGYLLACGASRHAAYIDPGDEASMLLDLIDEKELELICVLNTHAHLDHISGISGVLERWNVPVYLHQADEVLYQSLSEQARWFGLDYPPAPPLDYYLHPSKQLALGDLSIRVHHTPGHSPGSVCFEVENHLFCGDLVFAGSVGRTDLPGGSFEVLKRSVREKILVLEESAILHPGHGPDTTVGIEKRENPFIREILSDLSL